MNRSRNSKDALIAEAFAPQHAPRPLPLFLELVRSIGATDPDLAARALIGLRAYQNASRHEPAMLQPAIAQRGEVCLRDYGGEGPAAVLIPSLINPPTILDLDRETSLIEAIKAMGRRALLIDWGRANARSDYDVGGHVSDLLVPLLESAGERPALIGYCLGGTMAIAAANLVDVERVATLATPWHFSRYPDQARDALAELWRSTKPSAQALGALPMEMFQAAFWSLDRNRTIAKFADFGELPPDDPRVHRFVVLEDWANDGEPIPFPAARELIEDLFGDDVSGDGDWMVGGRVISAGLNCPVLHLTAAHDRIAPSESAPPGPQSSIPSGHVGMIVGSAREKLHHELETFLRPPRA